MATDFPIDLHIILYKQWYVFYLVVAHTPETGCNWWSTAIPSRRFNINIHDGTHIKHPFHYRQNIS